MLYHRNNAETNKFAWYSLGLPLTREVGEAQPSPEGEKNPANEAVGTAIASSAQPLCWIALGTLFCPDWDDVGIVPYE